MSRRISSFSPSAAGSRNTSVAVLSAAWLGALLALGGCSGEKQPTSLLLVTVDTLRADRLGAYGYFRDTTPNLDRLAGAAILFERVVTPMATTLPAHVSLFTATNPGRHGVVGNFKHLGKPYSPQSGLPTLAEKLSRAGWATAAFVSATPVKRESGIGAGFALHDQPRWPSRRGKLTVQRALEWLDSGPSQPFFLWVHLWDPHQPYEPPPGYQHLFRDDERALQGYLESLAVPGADDPEILRINTLYDREVRYADDQLGLLLRGLEERGLTERTAVVVTSDHGEGLGQHGWIDHGRIWNEQLLVPLVIRLPAERRARRVEALASLIDVVPTLDRALDLPFSAADRERFEGRSLLSPSPDRRSVLSERVHRSRDWGTGRKYALTDEEWKYFHLTSGPDRLFHLVVDPAETRDVLAEHPQVAARMKAEIEAMLAGYAAAEALLEVTDAVSEERRRELRSLGYVE